MKKLVRLLAAVLVLVFPAVCLADSPSESVVGWCTAQMASWSPPGLSQYPGAKETKDDGTLRYAEIARDAFSVAYDPSEPPVFAGPDGRARTLALMLSIADSESGFRKDVDLGVGPASRGDGGRSWCLMQVQLSAEDQSTHRTVRRIVMDGDAWKYANDGKTGWGGEDLVSDRKKCFRAGLHMIRVSMRACSYLPVRERLAVYTGGSCAYEAARKSSSSRIGKAMSWLFRKPAPMADVDVLSAQPSVTASALSPTNPSSLD